MTNEGDPGSGLPARKEPPLVSNPVKGFGGLLESIQLTSGLLVKRTYEPVVASLQRVVQRLELKESPERD